MHKIRRCTKVGFELRKTADFGEIRFVGWIFPVLAGNINQASDLAHSLKMRREIAFKRAASVWEFVKSDEYKRAIQGNLVFDRN